MDRSGSLEGELQCDEGAVGVADHVRLGDVELGEDELGISRLSRDADLSLWPRAAGEAASVRNRSAKPRLAAYG